MAPRAQGAGREPLSTGRAGRPINAGAKWVIIVAVALAVIAVLWFVVFPEVTKLLPAQY